MQAGTRAAEEEGLLSAWVDEVAQVLTSTPPPGEGVTTDNNSAPRPHLPLTVPSGTKQALRLERMMSSVVSEASGVIFVLGDKDCNLIDAAFGPFLRPERTRGKGGPRLWAAATQSGALLLDLDADNLNQLPQTTEVSDETTSDSSNGEDIDFAANHSMQTRLTLMALEVCNAVVLNVDFRDVESAEISNKILEEQLKLLCQCEREDLPKKLILCVRDWDPIQHHAGVMQSRVVPRFLTKALGTHNRLRSLFNVITCLFTDPLASPAEFKCAVAQLNQNVHDIQNHGAQRRSLPSPAKFGQHLLNTWHSSVGFSSSCCAVTGNGGKKSRVSDRCPPAAPPPDNVTPRPPEDDPIEVEVEVEVLSEQESSIMPYSEEVTIDTAEANQDINALDQMEDEECQRSDHSCVIDTDNSNCLQPDKYGKKRKGRYNKHSDPLRFPGPYDIGRHGSHIWQRAGPSDSSICLVIMLQQQFLALQARFEDLQKESYRREAQIGQLQQEIQRIHRSFPLESCL